MRRGLMFLFALGVAWTVMAESDRLRFMTFNIWGDYFGNPVEERQDGMYAVVEREKPDLLSLQEVTPNWWASVGFMAKLDGAYGIIRGDEDAALVRAGADLSHRQPNWVNHEPLLYRKDRLRLLDSGVEFFHMTLQSEKSVTWGVFEDLKSGKKFISFATHLWWKYNGDESHALRELNVRLILDTIARQKAKWGDLPVIGGGDLNCNAEGQPALRFFERAGYSDAGKCADETSSVPSEHSSPKRGADGRYHGEKGVVGKKGHAMLDRVFYTKGVHAYRHDVICDQATLDISDHSPVIVDFDLCDAAPLITCDYPGGNVKVLSVDAEKGVVEIAPDLRDTVGHWFHFDFTVRGAEGKTLKFQFPKDGMSYLSSLGPAICRDGQNWTWLKADGRRHEPDNAFTFTFGKEDHAVRFAVSIPYGQKEWEDFTARWRQDPRVTFGVLCKSQSGTRDVELLRVPCQGKAEYLFVFTARHHACETTGNPPMEGALQQLLSDSAEGFWAREHAECVFVPFMDKEGVENGDQGKNRAPWDHNRDYTKGRYMTVRAVKELILRESKGRQIVFLDLHSPYVRSFKSCPEQDEVFTIGTEREHLIPTWNRFREEWMAAQRGGTLKYDGTYDLKPGHGYWAKMKETWDSGILSADEWVRRLPNTKLSTCCEFGYSLCGGVNSREAMQELGANMFKAAVRAVK